MEKAMYSVSVENSVPCIKLPEKVLGGGEAVEFSTLAQQYLNDAQYSKIIVDLGEVNVMNSSGLGMLVAAYTTATKLKKSVNFINIPDKIMSLLKMTHLDKIFLGEK